MMMPADTVLPLERRSSSSFVPKREIAGTICFTPIFDDVILWLNYAETQ
jgi:hypothetical protein